MYSTVFLQNQSKLNFLYFFKFLWPFQKSWTLNNRPSAKVHVIVLIPVATSCFMKFLHENSLEKAIKENCANYSPKLCQSEAQFCRNPRLINSYVFFSVSALIILMAFQNQRCNLVKKWWDCAWSILLSNLSLLLQQAKIFKKYEVRMKLINLT